MQPLQIQISQVMLEITEEAISNWGILDITNSNFTSNTATQGGALNNYNTGKSILTVTESNLKDNTATNGGALYNDAGTSEIHFNSITGNTGTDLYSYSGTLNAQNNWWGTNNNPSSKVTGNVNITTWLVLTSNMHHQI